MEIAGPPLVVRFYRMLLGLFPPGFRRDAAPELEAWFAQAWREGKGDPLARVRLGIIVLFDLVRCLPPEWLDAILAPPIQRHPGASSMETLWQDLRYAGRTLRSAPLVTGVALLTIALGVGATTTMLSVANALLLRPPVGVTASDRLVTLHARDQGGSSYHSFSYPDFQDLAATGGGLQSLSAFHPLAASVRTSGDPELEAGLVVSGNYFQTLGTAPELGRFFGPAEDQRGGPPVVVLGDGLWRRRFGADPEVLGRQVVVNGKSLTVIGVAPAGFHGHIAGLDFSLWVPLALDPELSQRDLLERRNAAWLELVGRLAPGAERAGVQAAMSAVSSRIGREAGLTWDRTVDVRRYLPLPAEAAMPVGGFLGLLTLLAGFILLIASANVGTVLLARAGTRGREIALRVALGANRWRLLRQLLMESVALFLCGGAVGALLTVAGTRALSALRPPIEVPLALDFHPDLLVLGIGLLITLAVGVVFGLAPALQAARTDPAQVLREGSSTRPLGRGRLRGLLVMGQVAGSACLLITAGLFARGLSRAGTVRPGFDPSDVAVTNLDFSVRAYDSTRQWSFIRGLEQRVSAIPGVTSVATTDIIPLNLSEQSSVLVVPGRPAEPNVGQFQTDFTTVTPQYFGAMGLPLITGRSFSDADRSGAPAVAIVNQTLARRLWPDESPIGKRIDFGSFTTGTPTEIVGVASDASYHTLGEAPLSMIYLPMLQQETRRVSLLVRTSGAIPGLPAAVRDAVHEIDPELPVGQQSRLETLIGVALLPNRIALILATAFGATGLLLASVGLYGLLAFRVQSRRKEIGIRMALGASAPQVRALVVGEGIRLTAIGLVIGLLVAGVLARFLGTLLFGVSPVDPLTYAAIALLLLLVGWLAALGPTGRALRTEPVEVLRHD